MFRLSLNIYKAYWMLFSTYWYVYTLGLLVLGILVLKHKDEIISGAVELLIWMEESISKYQTRKLKK